jgi:hypothetical protein
MEILKKLKAGWYQFMAASSPIHCNARHQALYLLQVDDRQKAGH